MGKKGERMIKASLRMIAVAGLLPAVLVMTGCGPYTSTVVQLNREKYLCRNDPNQFSPYQGKRILLSTITDESKNTSNLAYYNPERTVGYQLFYSSQHQMPQPVVSYFWYALQKGFECGGVRIEEHGRIYDAELSLALKSLTDEEIRFQASLTRKTALVLEKEYVVTMPKVQAIETKVLEDRAYRMLDAIVARILNDQDFQKAFFEK
jgi:hypothetical protein